MAERLSNKRVAILVTDGFEQAELMEPVKALREAGATVEVISPSEGAAKTQKPGRVKGWDMTDWGKTVDVDTDLKNARAENYDALVLPGGVMNPDKLRQSKTAISFIKCFVDSGKPIGAICHGPWTLIEAGAVKGRTLTSWPSLQTDLRNAGANWVDKEVNVDNGLVTSRKPDDLPAFNAKLIEEIAEGVHARKAA